MLGTLGVSQVESDPRFAETPIAQLGAGSIDLEETEVNRLAVGRAAHPEVFKAIDYANLTRHRMYVTAIVANERFLASLGEEQRGLLTEEVEKLAVAERRLSVRLERENRELLAKEGLRWVELPEEQRAALAKVAESQDRRSPETAAAVEAIRAVPDPAGEQAGLPAAPASSPN